MAVLQMVNRNFHSLHVEGFRIIYKGYVRPHMELECGPMPNVVVALPNIGGALCSMLQSLDDAFCWSAVQ